MKKTLFAFIMMLTVLTICAQDKTSSSEDVKDITTFLGIPIDGTKAEMRQKLLDKGYILKKDRNGDEWLEGEFNGRSVRISIVTNNNKVWRIAVMDKFLTSENNVKARFNNLYHQFKNNSKYDVFKADVIPDNEDISYEMLANNKSYEASFTQKIDPKYAVRLYNEAKSLLSNNYTEEQLSNPTKEIEDSIYNLGTILYTRHILMKHVWFKIVEYLGEYGIVIYYENGYNQAHGEDL